jgi:hypothetical protein
MLGHQRLMREVNDRIVQVAHTLGDDGESFEFLCECDDSECTATVTSTLSEYTELTEDGWIVAEGHSTLRQEQVA